MIIPSYVDEMADGAIERLRMLEDGEAFNFAFINDPHFCISYVERALYAADKINKRFPIEFFCLGGDYLCNNDHTPRDEALRQHRELAEIIKEYKDRFPLIVLNGNHDDNPFAGPENRLHPDEIYDILMSHHSEKFVSDDKVEKAMYGYHDVPAKKLRAVYLNIFDPEYIKDGNKIFLKSERSNVISARQLEWLCEKGLELPENDWTVAIFAHCLPVTSPCEPSLRFFGGDILIDILEAFKDGKAICEKVEKGGCAYDIKCDFTGRGSGNLAGYFCGHYHRDWNWKVSGIQVVSQIAACSDNFGLHLSGDGKTHPKTRGSGEESAFSVFRVYPGKREVYCIRCGAGPDFSYNY